MGDLASSLMGSCSWQTCEALASGTVLFASEPVLTWGGCREMSTATHSSPDESTESALDLGRNEERYHVSLAQKTRRPLPPKHSCLSNLTCI